MNNETVESGCSSLSLGDTARIYKLAHARFA